MVFEGGGGVPLWGTAARPARRVQCARRGGGRRRRQAERGRPDPEGRGGAEATCRGSAVALRRRDSPAVLDMPDGKEAEP
ncbi:MAG: hypothetical protein ACE5JQ_00355 [Candidatus Methylomirabilales bacterium]